MDDIKEECLGNFVSPGAFFLHLGDETGGDGVAVTQLAQQLVDVERIEGLPPEVGEGGEVLAHVDEAVEIVDVGLPKRFDVGDRGVDLVVYLGGEHARHLLPLLVHAEAELEVFLTKEEALGEQGTVLLQQGSIGIEGATREESDRNVSRFLDVLQGLLGVVIFAESPFLLAACIPDEVAVAVVADEGRECQVVGVRCGEGFQLLEEVGLDDGVVVEQQEVVGLCRGDEPDGGVVAPRESDVLTQLVEDEFVVEGWRGQRLALLDDAMGDVLVVEVLLNGGDMGGFRAVVGQHAEVVGLHMTERLDAFDGVGCTVPVEHDDGGHTAAVNISR